MNNYFIELTEKDDAKILINVLHIAWIEPNKTGSTITLNIPNYSFPKKVKESYEEIRAKILS
jgi:hypothetical protein